MKKVLIYDENIIQNLEEKKHSPPVFFEVGEESLSLIQIGNKINVISPLVRSNLQQKAANALIQYLRE